jgi:hypothetical protein
MTAFVRSAIVEKIDKKALRRRNMTLNQALMLLLYASFQFCRSGYA